MDNITINNNNKIKLIFIIISIIIVAFSLTGNILSSKEGGALSLFTFESFYAYIITISISLYKVIKNKNANITIILTILTYIWTYYLVWKTIKKITDLTIIIEPLFYVYLSSSIFLIISLFFNKKNTKTIKSNTQLNNNILNDLDRNNFLFANFILGMKEIPFNAEILLVNNIQDNTLDLIYTIDSTNKTIKIPIKSINNISYRASTKMQNISKKSTSNEYKGILLSAVAFGGNPLLQHIGDSMFHSMLEDISNNYNKVNFSSSFEIAIETTINNQEIKFVVSTNTYPDKFIKLINY